MSTEENSPFRKLSEDDAEFIALGLAVSEAFKKVIDGDWGSICQTYVDINDILHERHNIMEGLIIVMMSLYNGATYVITDENTKIKYQGGVDAEKVLEAFEVICREFLNLDTDKLNSLFIKSIGMSQSANTIQ